MHGRKNLNKFPSKKIFGKKTILRALKKGDLKKCLIWLKDSSINMYLSQNFHDYTEEQELKWFEHIRSSQNDIVFAIEDIDTNLYIGNCALHKIDWEKGVCELGILIGEKDYWNRGFGSDAIRSVTNFALSYLNLISVVLNVYKYNHRAIKVYKKCGFKTTQIQKKDHFYGGKFWDTLVMELKKNKN